MEKEIKKEKENNGEIYTRAELAKLLDVTELTIYFYELKGYLKRVSDLPVKYLVDDEAVKTLTEHFRKIKRKVPDFLLNWRL